MRPPVRRFILAGIMLLALWLRLHDPGANEFNLDQAYPIHEALRILDAGELPRLGQYTSVLFASPPATIYLYFPVVALTRSPLVVYLLVALLNTLAVLFAWRIAAFLLPPVGALFATLLVAVNPWLVEYSRTTWLDSLFPFMVTLLLWLLLPLLLGRARRAGPRLLAALVTFTLLTQMHLLGFIAAAPVGLLLFRFRRRLPRGALLAGSAIFLATTVLFLYFLAFHPDTTVERVEQFRGEGFRLSRWPIEHTLRFATGADYPFARGMLLPGEGVALRQRSDRLLAPPVLLLILVGSLSLARSPQGKRREGALILLLWTTLPPLLLVYTPQNIHPYYLLLTVPGAALLAGTGAALLARWRVGALLLVPLSVAILLLHLSSSVAHYEETRRFPGAHGLSALPLEDGLRLGKVLNEQGADRVLADTDPWILSALAGRLLHFEFRHEYLDPRLALLARGEPTTHVLWDRQDLPYRHMAEVTLADGHAVQVVTIIPGEIERPVDYPTDQGIRLAGYERGHLDPGERGRLQLAWEVTAPPLDIAAQFQPFVHLYDATGNRVLIVHGLVIPATDWKVGDWQFHTLWLDIPMDARPPFRAEAGLYDPNRQVNATLQPSPGEGTTSVTLP